MRILYVSHTHPLQGTILENVGGMQRVSRQLVDELRRRDDVQVFTETVNVAGEGTVGLQTAWFLLKTLVMLPRQVQRVEADIILFSSMVTASLAWLLQKRINIPMVTINHGRDVTLQVKAYQKMVPRIFKALDGVISVSKATRQECIKRGMDPQKGVALPNGFNLAMMDDLPKKEAARASLQKQFSIPLDDKKMLLTVGRKVKRKGHEWFIREVFPKLTSDVVYVTVGQGPEWENVDQAVHDTHQSQAVFLLGRQPDAMLKKAYAAADLFVMPNIPVEGDMEGFGIVLLEANMARTPAVAANLEGIKDVIAERKNGYKVAVGDALRFAEKVDDTLNQNLEELSNSSRRYVQKTFAWSRVARQYITYLAEIIKNYNVDKSKK